MPLNHGDDDDDDKEKYDCPMEIEHTASFFKPARQTAVNGLYTLGFLVTLFLSQRHALQRFIILTFSFRVCN